MISPERRQEIIGSLRRGAVPEQSLDAFAVGLERFEKAIEEELHTVTGGGGVFKALRGEYGSGKTFFSRWLQERARRLGFATAEVQVSETDTPLHKLETVYRRLIERLATTDTPRGAFQSIVDGWFYTLEEDALAEGLFDEKDEQALITRSSELMEQRLRKVTREAPSFAAALRGYRQASLQGDRPRAQGLLAWLSGSPNVAASIKRSAGIKGDPDHYGAMTFLVGLLTILKDSGFSGLVLVLDEAETLQRVRTDTRDKAFNALRQLIDEVDAGRYPGLYILLTGTEPFFQGPQGISRLAPLAQRLAMDFQTHPRFDNPRAVQIRLQAFDRERLIQVGVKIRDLYAMSADHGSRISEKVDNAYVAHLADAVAGRLGGQTGIAPRLFLKKLVGEVLDRVDLFPDFNPYEHYQLTVASNELTTAERAISADDIELDL